MFEKIAKVVFSVLFLLMLVVPLLTTNLKKNVVSEDERRILAQLPELYNEDGTRNKDFNAGLEVWINDNIGFRSTMIRANAKLLYYGFHVMDEHANRYLGPNGELNYAHPSTIEDFQHTNLYSEEYLRAVADSLQYISDYVEKQGGQFYYYQCWDKQSIYPEYFPSAFVQYGDESKTDGIVKAFQEYSTVNVISPKQELIDGKTQYDTYSRCGDPTHWTSRGAYIGYLKCMESLNNQNQNQYAVLQEEDYNISIKDMGETVFGGIQMTDMIEFFEIKEPKAVLTNEKLTLYAEEARHRFYTNDSVDNDTRLLVIGDSYFQIYLMDDLAESFHETILIWGDYCNDIGNILDEYQADIVIVEAVERMDRTSAIRDGAAAMKESGR